MFSRRLPATRDLNALSRAIDVMRAGGTPFIDLTESNPTRVEIPYPAGLLDPLADGRGLRSDPQPMGLWSAREAVASDGRRRGAVVDPADVVLSASTSEAYSWLFKLLCDPGDHVLVPRPSYPLFEHLTRLEGVQTATYDLDYHGRWEIDFETVAAAPASTRAMLIVTPNNPTGSYISARDFERLVRICHDRGWALVADEVFADYPLEVVAPLTDVALRADVLAFTLGGASKSLGLPQIKLGWIVVGGPDAARTAALEALELVADTFLSVGTPVQGAVPMLLRDAADVRRAIHDRVRSNLACARELAVDYPACDVLCVEGGWSMVVRVPATRHEDQLVLDLLERVHVLVHPGYFFDFTREAFVVVSLLPPGAMFASALARVLAYATS